MKKTSPYYSLMKQLDEQLEFVDWLKSKGLYNPMEDAHTMQKMFEVWKEKK